MQASPLQTFVLLALAIIMGSGFTFMETELLLGQLILIELVEAFTIYTVLLVGFTSILLPIAPVFHK